MRGERRGQFNRVARFEPLLAEQFCRQFQAGDVPKISVHTGEVHQPGGWFIHNRLQSGANTAANGVGGPAEGDDPFGAVNRPHDFVLVKGVLGDVLRV